MEELGACAQCHGPITSFDFPIADNNGTIVQGVQTQVQNLLNQLSTLLPNSATAVVDGTGKDQSFCQDQLDHGSS